MKFINAIFTKMLKKLMIKALKQSLCLHFWGLSLYTAILGQFIRSIDIYETSTLMPSKKLLILSKRVKLWQSIYS